MRKNIIVETQSELIQCKFCNSTNIVRFGTRNGIQRYWCKDCEHKFVDNKALPGFRVPIDYIGSALNLFYDGLSLNEICRHLDQDYHYFPSDSTVYEWIIRFTNIAISEVGNYKATTGDTWIADETVLKIGGQNLWFWDIIDNRTRFLLASHFSISRTTKDANILMSKAIENSKFLPKIIVTDKLRAYMDGIEMAFGAYTQHLTSQGFKADVNTNLIERFHGTIKDRTKVMRGMKNLSTAKIIMGGWLIHYNFFRPHESLNTKTPSRVAKIVFPFSDWKDIVAIG